MGNNDNNNSNDNNESKNKNPFSSKGDSPKPNKNFALILVVLLLGLLFLFLYKSENTKEKSLDFSVLLEMIENKEIKWKKFTIIEQDIYGEIEISKDNDTVYDKYKDLIEVEKVLAEKPEKQQSTNDERIYTFSTYSPSEIDFDFIKKLQQADIKFNSEQKSSNTFLSIITGIIPWLLIFGILWFIMFRQIQGTGNKALSFGKSRAKLAKNNHRRITFKDVAGVEEAKEELKETIEFLKDPERFKKLGAKIPRGVLLTGPPGTGKTLLARSVAGESNRPFFTMSGSEFVEMFVGVGASRVRDLFEQGKKSAPCIIFIDELDAVGRTRGAGYGGGHDEREQTLNQMLVEMDGFDSEETIIIMAATNRPDVLDPALLRPGRFDRRVIVSRPDIKGREAIIKVHMEKVPVAKSVDVKILSRGTPGFSGADLANMVNEAALIAARRNKRKVQMDDFEDAKDKVLMGPERRSLVISEKEKLTTAYHEAGHAILAYLLPTANPLHKVTIIPRGNALGVTWRLPEDDRHTLSKQFCLEEIMVLFGGRICEEYKFGAEGITTGAANDIEKVTQLARSMICEWGMSDKLGPVSYGQKDEPIFIGKEIARHKDYSERTAEAIDYEITSIINNCFDQAKKIIMDNIGKIEILAQSLLEKEVLDKAEIDSLLGEA